jgi:hypothetical protein
MCFYGVSRCRSTLVLRRESSHCSPGIHAVFCVAAMFSIRQVLLLMHCLRAEYPYGQSPRHPPVKSQYISLRQLNLHPHPQYFLCLRPPSRHSKTHPIRTLQKSGPASRRSPQYRPPDVAPGTEYRYLLGRECRSYGNVRSIYMHCPSEENMRDQFLPGDGRCCFVLLPLQRFHVQSTVVIVWRAWHIWVRSKIFMVVPIFLVLITFGGDLLSHRAFTFSFPESARGHL